MKALCWHGTGDVRVDTVADPTIQDARDIILKITSTAICGSDLHLFNGFQPTMEKGDQYMGDVVEVGRAISTLKVGDMCCRKAGTISVPGVYIGLLDKIPFGAAMNKGITFRMGQTHVPRYTKPLLEKIQSGAIDPSFVTHRVALADAPAAYKTFRDKDDGCIKVVLKP
jgi:threonine dehydrogenase-like Zn-dependent dehydrogenase